MSKNVGGSQPLLTTSQLSLIADPFFLVSHYVPEATMEHSPQTINKNYLLELRLYTCE